MKQKKQPIEPSIRYAGPSTDLRTNKWSVTCSCGKIFIPVTTMRSTQNFSCPKCDTHYFVDYNKEPVKLEKSNGTT